MSEDKIQDTKEALLKFSKITTLSDVEQTILRNGANAINQEQNSNNLNENFAVIRLSDVKKKIARIERR